MCLRFGDSPLLPFSLMPHPPDGLVSDFFLNGDWNVTLLAAVLPPSLVAAIQDIPIDVMRPDVLSFGGFLPRAISLLSLPGMLSGNVNLLPLFFRQFGLSR